MSAPVYNKGFDVLRGAVTLLVVFHHTAITYGGSGGWFYREVPQSGQLSSMLLTLFVSVNQAWFMGLFFLLAGYYMPASLERKGNVQFVRDRLLRLGLPLLAFGLLLGPFTEALAKLAKRSDLWALFLAEEARVRFVFGPLWFVWALLWLSLAALLTRLVLGRLSFTSAVFPSRWIMGVATLATGLAAFGLRQVWPIGTEWAGVQIGYCASYVVLFAAGCMAAQCRLLETIPQSQVRFWRNIALIALPVLPVAAQLHAPKPLLEFIYALWEPFVAVGIILWLLDLFNRKFAEPSSLMEALGRRAYTIFIIHAPILVAMALLWRGVAAPPLVKFLVTGILACAASFLLAGPLVKAPGLRRIL